MPAVPVYYAPDIDGSWDRSPGALANLSGFAPMQIDAYGSIGSADYLLSEITGTNILSAATFRVSTGVRLLVFRTQDIDEYNSAGTRTNRGTGYGATTDAWNAATWGDQIIACNSVGGVPLGAIQSSTGGAFTALGGGAPKASRIAANLNFVMLACIDDGGSNVYNDMVWWSALQNPNDWVPSLATQCGRIRLLDAPGSIRALVAYRDMFIAFKENAIFVGRYQGPFIFEWTIVSNRIGCTGSKAVCELDGRLYFLHESGFYEFDGQNLRNIGTQVFQSFLSEHSGLTGASGGVAVGDITSQGLNFTKAVADDIEGIVWFTIGKHNNTIYYMNMYGYNVRRGKWGRARMGQLFAGQASSYPVAVQTQFSELNDFKADTAGRLWVIFPNSTATEGTRMLSYRYPMASQSTMTLTTCTFGEVEQADKLTTVTPRHLQGSDAITTSNISGLLTSYKQEDLNSTVGTGTLTANVDLARLDGQVDGRFKRVQIDYAAATKVILGGVTLEGSRTGKR